MAHLFKIDKAGDLVKAVERPFEDEVSEMEPLVKGEQPSRLLGEWFIFGQQIAELLPRAVGWRISLGVNRDGGIAVIELKRTLSALHRDPGAGIGIPGCGGSRARCGEKRLG